MNNKIIIILLIVAFILLLVGFYRKVSLGKLSQNLTPRTISNNTTDVIYGANIISNNINISQVKESGIKITTYWLYIPQFIDANGNINSENLNRNIDRYSQQRGGIEVMVHLIPQAREEASKRGGFYSPDFNLFAKQTSQIALSLKGKVKYYSVGNEVPATWSDTTENYGKMLQSAYGAIKSVNSEAVVLDSGMSSLSYTALVGKDIKAQQNKNAAINFINGYTRLHSTKILKQFEPLENNTNLEKLFNLSEFAEAENYIDTLLGNYCENFDVYQLHFYQESQYLDDVIDWVNKKMSEKACVKPIHIWELGYGVDKISNYDPEAHAENVRQTLTIAAEKRIGLVNYVTFYEKTGFARGLYEGDGSERPAGQEFKSIVTKTK